MSKTYKPQVDRYQEALNRQRALKEAMPVGSRCFCEACRLDARFQRGDPEALEAELRS